MPRSGPWKKVERCGGAVEDGRKRQFYWWEDMGKSHWWEHFFRINLALHECLSCTGFERDISQLHLNSVSLFLRGEVGIHATRSVAASKRLPLGSADRVRADTPQTDAKTLNQPVEGVRQ